MDPVVSWDAWRAKTARWVTEADADLLVFPEYGAMELACLDGLDAAADLERSLHAVARHGPQAQAHWAALAKDHACAILTPSGPWDAGQARPVNRAWFHGADGTLGYQDKQIMTRFEREVWDVQAGDPLRVFEVGDVRIGVLICYDAEFPVLAESLFRQGVDLLLVPSCTDGLAGYNRVRIGAMSRALEGQCVVVQAPTVGACDWSPAVDENRGAAAIYGPPDLGFPDDGILAVGPLDVPGWVRAEIDPVAIARVRADGQVLNHAHRSEAARRAARLISP
ncbi:amidohydrolase [Jannaschia pagri]|uniref:Amidohydrolase n=2 Tax=Roseobacteraceae TaxID=2854170 RepID=A0ABQ4NR86_9RHOB|nr:amidohydrolase [Jannaschia sp. AI_61]GIT96935.1 amidohydrolase [Jannaschia sp. AI_62]